MIEITTTRFNKDTWNENQIYRSRLPPNTCIYGVPSQLSCKIPLKNLVFVIEMNNSTNKIEGVGLIRNQIQHDKYYKIYQYGNYNRYTYKSDYYLDRNKLTEENEELVKLLDTVLFKGKTHLKRGSGFTMITEKCLKQHEISKEKKKEELSKEIQIIFEKIFKKIEEKEEKKENEEKKEK
jgi:hypothetical protein